MLAIQSKLTSQGQVSVPAVIRQLLNLAPGGVLEWYEENGRVTVARAVRHSTQEVHTALFGNVTVPAAPANAEPVTSTKTLEELKQGIRQHMKKRHARR